MKIRDLMTTNVITVGPEAPLKEAARRMISAGISGLAVTDDSGALVGVITEADFVKAESGRRASTRARLLRWLTNQQEMPNERQTVDNVMTKDVITLPPDADHAEAARVMNKAGIKRVLVLDESGNLCGLVSRSDILRAFARPDLEIIEEIRDHILKEVLLINPVIVDVKCEDGNVSLRGHLETRNDAQLLVLLTRGLDGVVSVKDQLTWQDHGTESPGMPLNSYQAAIWR
jgi:CBS domain-containing protein